MWSKSNVANCSGAHINGRTKKAEMHDFTFHTVSSHQRELTELIVVAVVADAVDIVGVVAA